MSEQNVRVDTIDSNAHANSFDRDESVARSEALPVPEHTSAAVVVFTNGCFDLFHAGHAVFLQQCRSFGTRLIIGLNSDESVRRLKGPTRPICSQDERRIVLESCRHVDEVILFDDPTACELIRRIKPDIYVKGPGYSESNMPEAAIVKRWACRVVILDGPPISTTTIIERIQQRA